MLYMYFSHDCRLAVCYKHVSGFVCYQEENEENPCFNPVDWQSLDVSGSFWEGPANDELVEEVIIIMQSAYTVLKLFIYSSFLMTCLHMFYQETLKFIEF